MRAPLPESCRPVQGSKQEPIRITSEQRAERPSRVSRPRRFAPDTAPASAGRKARTRVVPQRFTRLCLLWMETKALSF